MLLAIGAAIGAAVIDEYGWRAIFLSAAILGSVTTIACYIALPESVNFLIARQPPNALARINKLRQRFGQTPLTELPPRPQAPVRYRR